MGTGTEGGGPERRAQAEVSREWPGPVSSRLIDPAALIQGIGFPGQRSRIPPPEGEGHGAVAGQDLPSHGIGPRRIGHRIEARARANARPSDPELVRSILMPPTYSTDIRRQRDAKFSGGQSRQQ